MFDLQNKTVMITGAAGFLGEQHVEAVATAGGNVAILDLRGREAEEMAAKVAKRHGVEVAGFGVDITDQAALETCVAEVEERLGGIDALINNAALNDKRASEEHPDYFAPFESYPLELWDRALQVNLTGAFLCSQTVGKRMVARGGGVIVNISSIYGIKAPDQRLYVREGDPAGEQNYKPVSYTVTKGALISLTRYLAAYWGNKKIRVNTITLGGVFDNQDEEFVEKYTAKTPLGRMADRGDFKGAVVFLLSDEASYMTGANIVIDGGWSAW